MNNCPNCGIAITVPTSFCPQCGGQLEAQPPPEPPPPDPYTQPNPYLQPSAPIPTGPDPGYAPYATQGQPPDTGTAMAISILTLLFCSPLFGIIGLVMTSGAKTAIVNDDYEQARSKIKTAYLVCGIGAGISALMTCIAVPFVILMMASGM
jgi:hypothetical protein